MGADTVELWQRLVPRIWLWAWAFAIFGLITNSSLLLVASIVYFVANFWFTNKYPVEDGPVTEESL